ncbi:MAG: hypothetical protein LBH43_05650 [Treponema sp.]|jgi:5-methyltetrahydrofolate--homocysteine methyltransferase|nr:hypothetical protein [Treponema sp.]
MRNTYIDNWQAVKDRFEQWWNREESDRPMMRIVARGNNRNGLSQTRERRKPENPKDQYLNARNIVDEYRNYCETRYFLAEAFPAVDLNLGPGSLALYLGGEPEFTWETLWYKEKCGSPAEFRDLHYDENNQWWVIHQKMIKEAVELSEGDFYVTIPDIVENVDILSALRGPQNFCFDVIDEPEAALDGVKIIDDLYFKYYDRFYDIAKDDDLSSSYTAFKIMGSGKTAKIQCDFCAMISPEMFRDLVQPSLAKQCMILDHSLYHLDGPDAIKHVPALMEIKELDALQWTCGAGKPDGACEDWYQIYDQVREAEKGLWISFEDGSPEDWAGGAKRLVKRYGAKGLYFLFPEFSDLAQAKKMAALFE